MKIVLIDDKIKIENNSECVLCLGMFDGVHSGHRELIKEAVNKAKELGIPSAVMTFLSSFEENKIYPFEERCSLFEKLGIDILYVVSFTQKFKDLSCEEFINKYLIEYTKASYIVCGFNFRFGKNREGDTKTLQEALGHICGITVVPEVIMDGETVSSTLIKSYLKEGNIAKVNSLLNDIYSVSGIVIKGNEVGRTINFPTANIAVPSCLVPLKSGVYSTKVSVDGKFYKSISNIGNAPTVRNDDAIILETHILDYNGDLYNKYIKVFFLDFIREERKFKNIDELKAAIKLNIEARENSSI